MKETLDHPAAGFTRRERKDLRILALFTAVYCRGHHRPAKERAQENPLFSELDLAPPVICADCLDFLRYAVERRLKCPLDPKPTCKHCHVHCYRPGHREKVREIMRYSGKRLILRGRLDLLWHYFF